MSQLTDKEKRIKAVREWEARNPEKRRLYQKNADANRDPIKRKQQLAEAKARYRKTDKFREANRRDQRNRRLDRDEMTIEYANIIADDPCSYCGETGGTIDHILPRKLGGSNLWVNLTSACGSCNSSKQDKNLLEFLVEQLIADEGEFLVPTDR